MSARPAYDKTTAEGLSNAHSLPYTTIQALRRLIRFLVFLLRKEKNVPIDPAVLQALLATVIGDYDTLSLRRGETIAADAAATTATAAAAEALNAENMAHADLGTAIDALEAALEAAR